MHLIRCSLVGGFALALLMLTDSVGRTDASTPPTARIEVLICVGKNYPDGCGPRGARQTWGDAGAQHAGLVSGPRIRCGRRSGGRLNSVCRADFPDDRKVTLTVTKAGTGLYIFRRWYVQSQDACGGGDETCTVSVQVGRTVRVRAVFSSNPY